MAKPIIFEEDYLIFVGITKYFNYLAVYSKIIRK